MTASQIVRDVKDALATLWAIGPDHGGLTGDEYHRLRDAILDWAEAELMRHVPYVYKPLDVTSGL